MEIKLLFCSPVAPPGFPLVFTVDALQVAPGVGMLLGNEKCLEKV